MDRVAERAGLRREFSGMPCRCGKRTEGEFTQCPVRGHGRKLGMVKKMHRRAEAQWMGIRFENLRDVVGVGGVMLSPWMRRKWAGKICSRGSANSV